jgi:hypothetical protein
MKLSSRALLNRLFFAPKAACAQSVTRVKQAATTPVGIEGEVSEEIILAARSMLALKRLEKDVLVYRSLGDFESNGKLARVSYQAFRNDLNEVTTEVEAMLSRLPQSKLKIELGNALASYRDGQFWWQQIHQPRIVSVSALPANGNSRPSDPAFLSTIAYTVAIHWRQANRYLRRAEQLMNGRTMLSKSPTLGLVSQSVATFAPSASAR